MKTKVLGVLGVTIGMLLAGACSSDPATPSNTGAPDGSTNPDANGSSDAETDAGPPAQANIRTTLECGPDPGVGNGPAEGLMRFELDSSKFPDALCNDGSVAVFHFRPYVGEANRNKWLLNLHGGGSCGSGPTCAARWCSCDSTTKCPFVEEPTNFDRGTMFNDSPPIRNDDGIFLRGDAARPNPLGDYNQVIFQYCSSDTWRGSSRGVELTANNPKTGTPVTFSLHFLGAKILDANLTTLRADGVPPLVFTQKGSSVQMPDLDDADEVVVTGDSAGGSGVVTNLDYMNELLRSKNTKCSGASCPLKVYGLIDATTGLDRSKLDYGAHVSANIRSYQDLLDAVSKSPIDSAARHDQSCVEYHKSRQPGSETICNDESHVIRHHVTTPFFIRQALRDVLVVKGYVDQGLRDSSLQPLTATSFPVLLQGELSKFDTLPTTAEEGAAMTRAPGVFAPGCTKHDTIHSTPDTFATTITPASSSPLRLFPVLTNWVDGKTPSNVLTQSPTLADTNCP